MLTSSWVNRARWFLGGIFVSLTACASLTGPIEYPASWASIASPPTADGCPHLAGLYSNRPSRAVSGEASDALSLTEVFSRMAYGPGPREYSQTWSVPTDAVSVSISQTPEDLLVTFVGAKGERTSQPFRRLKVTRLEKRYDDLFTCRVSNGEPRLSFPFTPASQRRDLAAYVYMGGSDTFIFLLKAVDGTLVVQSRSESIGLSLFIIGSHYSVDSTWSRYPAIAGSR
jgi:hypothetical protein